MTVSDCFSVSDHDSVSEQGDDNGESEETRNIPLGVEDISEDIAEDFENDVEGDVAAQENRSTLLAKIESNGQK
jgi:hypothetical protein